MLSIRPYQAEGIEFLTSHRRAALWDRPGLGKSMQALLSMDYQLGDNARILVVATGDALGVWQDETERWLGTEAALYAGTKANESALDHQGVVITNYHRAMTALGWGQWDGVVFDESQMLRNRNTRTLFKGIRSLFDNRQYGLSKTPAYFLSGTPIVKHAGDVWPILHLIDKQKYRGYWKFVREYCIVYEDELGHLQVEAVTNVRKLWAELAEVALRRENLDATPGRVRQRVPLEMTPKQARAYRDMERQMWIELDSGELLLTGGVLGRETRLRQILACPRILGIEEDGAALNYYADLAERTTEPFVMFTPFNEAMPYASAAIGRRGRSVVTLRGGTDFRARVAEFKARAKAESPGPVLISQVMMGKSWDVTEAAHECGMLGIDWNNTTMDQAESRLDRTGQTQLTICHYPVHRGTHDIDALDILSGKKRLEDVILNRKIGLRRKRA